MARAPVILIVSEHEWASRSLDTILAPRGYAIQRAYNGAQARERISMHQPDGVFIERSLPDISGPELCRQLRDQEVLAPATPIIITTPSGITQEQRIEALRSGAWEIISLPIDAEELLLRLSRYTRAKREADRARESARTDPETGLYNEIGILQRTSELAAAAQRYGRPLACVVFEPVSTNGDTDTIQELLSEIVAILKRSTRRSDVVGRIGPHQFAIVAPDTEPGGAEVLADRLRKGSTDSGAGGAGKRFRARAGAFGVADPTSDQISPDDLIHRAMNASREPGAPELN